MVVLEIREVGVEDESPLLMVGLAESTEGEGRDFVFQCDLRRNEYLPDSNWPEGDSYCVTNQAGMTNYGAVREVELRSDVLRVVFTAGAVRDLHLEDSEFEFRINSNEFDREEFRRCLRSIVTCGRPEYHPTLVEL
ncbi:Imm10 family immunity protein [Streptomyces sp. SID2888]|uniref:Imm10 family immunity protein n=1 Tax=Streptomyces sp. SID2888 TaxID=2690256 RepID=UPI001369700C|nr:hypothetical protein [Streptomyces sp. SID2888]